MNPRAKKVLREWRGSGLADEEPLPGRDLPAVVQRVFTRLGMADRFREAALTEGWPEMVGPTLAVHCRPGVVRRGVLCVLVDHSAWLHQIALLHKRNILLAVQRRFPHLNIKDLHLRVG